MYGSDASLEGGWCAKAREQPVPLAPPARPAGTPSLLPLPLLEEILAALDRRFGLAAGAEVSIEADPGTFDAQRLRSYMGLGVNRFSVGVQVHGVGVGGGGVDVHVGALVGVCVCVWVWVWVCVCVVWGGGGTGVARFDSVAGAGEGGRGDGCCLL